MLMMVALAAAAFADAATVQRDALDVYRACVVEKSLQFHKTDLSGDAPEIAVKAATFKCTRERTAMIEATQLFLRERHPGLTPGSLGKVTTLFVEMQDRQITEAAATALAGN